MDYSFYKHEQTVCVGSIYSKESNIVYKEDQDVLLVGSLETVSFLNIKKGEVVKKLKDGCSMVTYILLRPGSNEITVGYKDGIVRIWSSTGELNRKLSGHKSFISGMKYNETGNILATFSTDGIIVLWDALEDIQIGRLKRHKKQITDILFVEKRNIMISCSKDSTIRIWDLITKECVQVLSGFSTEVFCLSMCEDKKSFFVGTKDKGVFLYKIEEGSKGEIVSFVSLINEIKEVFQICQKGKFVWFLSTKELLYSEIEEERRLSLIKKDSFDTNQQISCMGFYQKNLFLGFKNNKIKLVGIEDEKIIVKGEVSVHGHRNEIKTLSISPNQKTVFSGSLDTMKIWKVQIEQLENELLFERTVDCIGCLCSEFVDDVYCLVGTKNGEVLSCNTRTGDIVLRIKGHEKKINSIHSFYNGFQFLTGGSDKKIIFWKKKEDGFFQKEDEFLVDDEVLSVKFVSAHSFVCASLLDSTIRVFYKDTMRQYLSLYGHKLPVLSIDVSPDGSFLISGSIDKNIKIWSLSFGDCRKSIFAHNDVITSVCFSNKGNSFFSASKDGKIKLWDGSSFQMIEKFDGHHSEVKAFVLGKEENFVLSGSKDNSIRMWRQTTEEIFEDDMIERDLDERIEDEMKTKKSFSEKDKSSFLCNSVEFLKDGEKIIAALEICEEVLNKQNIKEKNLLINGIEQVPSEYFFQIVQKTTLSHLEDFFVMIPFHMLWVLFQCLLGWSEFDDRLILISRIVSSVVGSNLNQILINKELNSILEKLYKRVDERIKVLKKITQKNISGLKIFSSEIKEKDIWL